MDLDRIAVVAEGALRPLLGPLGFDHVEVTAGKDHDGDPALFISAHYREGSQVPKGDVLLKALGAVHEALQREGEERFPYLDHRFEGEEGFEEEDLEETVPKS